VKITNAIGGAIDRTVELVVDTDTLVEYELEFFIRFPAGFVKDAAGNDFAGLLTPSAGAPSYQVESDTYPPKALKLSTSASSTLRLVDTAMDGGESVIRMEFSEVIQLPTNALECNSTASDGGCRIRVFRLPDGTEVHSVSSFASGASTSGTE